MVKLGGSAITDKRVSCKARRADIARLAKELAPFASELLIVHGAGSFGHIGAAKYGLKKGLSSKKSLLGAATVQREVRELNLIVCEALHKAKVPAVSIPPSAFIRFTSGSLSGYDLRLFSDAVANGFVPVTFGDVVPDFDQGVAICSGDVLVKLLASEFKAKAAVFASDVDGVFDADPKQSCKAKLLTEIDPLRPFNVKSGSSKVEDVTGAMAGKLEAALDVAALGADVYIVNGRAPGRLAALLGGKQGKWTRIGGIG
ncbi:MAG: isopentenyl phosphate kinase [Methanobacteriota archaeon]